MRTLLAPDDGRPVIAIVGGGASGTLTALQLLRQAASQRLAVQVALIDRHGRHGLGQAYSTAHDAHLLNTMAGQMSALPDDPDHLVRWAGVSRETFLPRRLYGRYLRDALAEAEILAPPTASLTRISAEITSVGHGGPGRALRLTGPDGWLDADLAVLALGNQAAPLPFAAPVRHRIVGDPWHPGALSEITDGEPVLIVGTGLTMIDLAMTISSQSPGADIYAVSRHGLLPAPHPSAPACGRSALLPLGPAATGRLRLGPLMAEVRAAVAADPERWPDVMAAIRPLTPGLWRDLPEIDKRVFLRHVARYWEVHRHLVPPATLRTITALRQSGQLRVLAGNVREAVEADGRFRVRVGLRDDGRPERPEPATREFSVGWIVSAAGAPADITAAASPLLRSLFAAGVGLPDSLRLGLDATPWGALVGRSGSVSDTMFTLGPPLRGIWYETTAIPEIRVQAADLARRLAARLAELRGGGARTIRPVPLLS